MRWTTKHLSQRVSRRVVSYAVNLGGRFQGGSAPAHHLQTFDDLIAESNNFGDVSWLGHPIWQNPLDLWTMQEVISSLRPTAILETGTNRGGSSRFYAHLLRLLEIDGTVVTVDIERLHDLREPNVEYLIGDSVGAPVLDRMRQVAAESPGPVLVILDSDHAADHVLAEMDAYSGLVTPGSLMQVQDGVIDVLPRFVSGRPGPLDAIERWLPSHPEFEVVDEWDQRFLLSHHPRGWLRRKT